MSTMKITQDRYETKKRHYSTAKVYVENTELHKLVDEWFSINKIGTLEFRCKTWAQIGKEMNSFLYPKIAKAIGVPTGAVRWSQSCGCRCGCSPGFIVTVPGGNPFGNHNVWGTVEISPEEIATMKLVLTLATIRLARELSREKEKETAVASQEAKAAAQKEKDLNEYALANCGGC